MPGRSSFTVRLVLRVGIWLLLFVLFGTMAGAAEPAFDPQPVTANYGRRGFFTASTQRWTLPRGGFI
jgi:hypothetical protein